MLFAPTSFWNQRLPGSAPIDPDSAAYVANLVAQTKAVAPGFEFRDFAVSVFYAAADCPTQAVTIDQKEHETEFWVKFAEMMSAVPIPPQARPVGPWFGDNHMVIIQPSTDKMWEFWKMSQFEIDGPHTTGQAEGAPEELLHKPGWHCESGAAYQNVSKNQGFYDDSSWPGFTGVHLSAVASGLPLAGGVITVAEAQRLYIPHAITATVKEAAKTVFRWPASKTDGTTETAFAPLEGMWFRLPANYNIASVKDPFTRAVCVAIRDYGLLINDTGGAVSIKCESQATVRNSQAYTTDAWKGPENKFGSTGAIMTSQASELAEHIPWSALEVVAESYRPSSIAPGLLGKGS
jgi:hypothetical protein